MKSLMFGQHFTVYNITCCHCILIHQGRVVCQAPCPFSQYLIKFSQYPPKVDAIDSHCTGEKTEAHKVSSPCQRSYSSSVAASEFELRSAELQSPLNCNALTSGPQEVPTRSASESLLLWDSDSQRVLPE